MAKKSTKWIKKRHKILQAIAKFVMKPLILKKYSITVTKNKENRQRLIISNHQTAFDQFFVAYGFNAPVYYVASEDLFSNGFISKLLKFAVNPIPIKKQATDVRAVLTCMKVAKEGGTIAIFPEGNRTFSGTTEHISIAIVKLIKALKLPLTFFRIEGGYGVQPRWSDKVRKGKMKAYTLKTLEVDEYMQLSDQDLYQLINKELFVDEQKSQTENRGKNKAEYLERLIYVCPNCGIANFESERNLIKCKSCGRQVKIDGYNVLSGVNFDFPFTSVKKWYEYQKDFINALNLENYFETPIFKDIANVYEVELYKRKKLLKTQVEILAYGDRLLFDNVSLNFKDVSAISVLGRNKLNVYCNDNVYQIKGNKRFNAVKYVNLCYRYKNQLKGDENEQFLGL